MKSMAVSLEEGDFLPFNEGTMPTEGIYGVCINAHELRDRDFRYFRDFWWDGDKKRPIFMGNDIPVSTINKLVKKFGDKMFVIAVADNTNGKPVYVKAKALLNLKMMIGWVDHYQKLEQQGELIAHKLGVLQ